MTAPFDAMSRERFRDYWRFYRGLAHQDRAIDLLHEIITSLDERALRESAPWATAYRTAPTVAGTPKALDVPYFSQLDNTSGQGHRECFSSSCAMIAAYYKRVESDDQYNLVRAKYGDTTDAQAHLSALRQLALKPAFHTDGDEQDILSQLKKGRPVAVGWLHKGTIKNPSGGGHWSVIIGSEGRKWTVHDPYGEADLVNGGYTANTDGAAMSYSFNSFNPRWEADGPQTGWWLEVAP
jgi:hypothetical protein